MTEPLAIDICVCTFRRPQLAATLMSLAALKVEPHWRLRAIVADNDETPSAAGLVAALAAPFPIQYIHAPARNISVARNACLDAATAPLIAFIDDDEVATPDWLRALVTVLQAQDAAAVLGPVDAVYPAHGPAWLRQGDFHATRPVWVWGAIVTGYTCNVLLRRDIVERLRLRFDPALGRSGGEDTLFFSAIHAAQGRIAYAADARVTEIVTPARQRFGWLWRRSFRSGQTHGRLLAAAGKARLRAIMIAGAKAAVCFALAALHLCLTVRGRRWLLRGSLHAGVVAYLCGRREAQHYG